MAQPLYHKGVFMGAYKITCNHAGCKNYIIGKFGFKELAKKHDWKQTGGIVTCYVCPDHQDTGRNKIADKPVKVKSIEKNEERED